MKQIIALMLVGLLVAPPASAGQKPNPPVDWNKVQQLQPGKKITLTVRGQSAMKVRFLGADDEMLVTLRPTHPKLAGRVERALFDIGGKWPGILNRGEGFESGSVRVSQEGVFDGPQRVANLSDLVQGTQRGDVLAIPEAAQERPHSHWVRNLLIGFALVVAAVILTMAATGYLAS